jgi:hypothetical protein
MRVRAPIYRAGRCGAGTGPTEVGSGGRPAFGGSWSEGGDFLPRPRFRFVCGADRQHAETFRKLAIWMKYYLWANMKNFFYQILHPWHWLTYGQNATGLAAAAALLGLVGLYFYTRYTRRMMELGELTNRATITPILVSSGAVQLEAAATDQTPASELGFLDPTVTAIRAIVRVRNVGEGAAIYLDSWAQTVSATFEIDTSILTRTSHVISGEHTVHELLKGESTEVRFARSSHPK